MPSTAELICVDPKRVHEFWPHVEGRILSAVRKTRISHPNDIVDAILCGDALLWLAWKDGVEAAASTIIQHIEGEKVCVLTACGGAGRKEWLHLIAGIEAYAKNEGCSCVRIFGRKGWSRVLKDYEVTNHVIEKAL